MNKDGMLARHPPVDLRCEHRRSFRHAAAVSLCVGVDDLAVKPGVRHAQPIIVAHQRRRIHTRTRDNFRPRRICA